MRVQAQSKHEVDRKAIAAASCRKTWRKEQEMWPTEKRNKMDTILGAVLLAQLEGGIKSGLSYSGARNLTELRRKVEWSRQTSAGTQESGTHIFNQNGMSK